MYIEIDERYQISRVDAEAIAKILVDLYIEEMKRTDTETVPTTNRISATI